MLDRLEGMFACALYDKKRHELYLFRDRIGIKPLYFSLQNGMLTFASEIKSLWHAPWIERSIEHQFVSHYLAYMVTPAPLTLFKEVYKLPAGHYVKCDAQGKISFTQWYDLLAALPESLGAFSGTKQDAHVAMDDLLQQAVTKRLQADVPVGVLLSGGIDSGLLAAYARQSTDFVPSFTIASKDDIDGDERASARMVSKHLGTVYHEKVFGMDDVSNWEDTLDWYLDEPHADPVCAPFSLVTELVREKGIKAVLVGEGADELFGGYPIYQRYQQLYSFGFDLTRQYLPSWARRFLAHLMRPIFSSRTIQDVLDRWSLGQHLFWSSAMPFSDQERLEMKRNSLGLQLHDSIVEKIYPGISNHADPYSFIEYHSKRFEQRFSGVSRYHQNIYLEFQHRIPELLLMRADKMSMAHGVEARVPFLDHHVVEYAFQIPDQWHFEQGKTKVFLRKIAKQYLPQTIIDGRKRGFSVPLHVAGAYQGHKHYDTALQQWAFKRLDRFIKPNSNADET
jgi:asparagine synthase (glutamine-hydrolysing)